MSVHCKPSLSNDMKSSLNEFQNEINVLSKYWEDPSKAISIAKKHLELNPDLEFINGWGTPMGVLEELAVKDKKEEKKNKGKQGGKRKGAGRHKGTPSKVTRVPEPLLGFVEKCTEDFKTGATNKMSLKVMIDYFETLGFELAKGEGYTLRRDGIEFTSTNDSECWKELKDDLMKYLESEKLKDKFMLWCFANGRMSIAIS